jgi:hypothetical protein
MNRVYLGDEPLIAFKTISCPLDLYFLSFSFFGIIAKKWPKKVAQKNGPKRWPLSLLRGQPTLLQISLEVIQYPLQTVTVPDMRSRDHEVVVVGRTINLGTGNLEWGGNGEGF